MVALAACALAVAAAPSTPAQSVPAAASTTIVPGSPAPGTTPGQRFFNGTSNSRTEYWRVALLDFADHPVLGSGAGTFVREWYRHRRIDADVQNAHSLYLETLAELGVGGLALLLFVMAMPVLGAWRARAAPFVAGGFGAFAAFAAHAAVDWDWQLPGITLAGLFCGTLLVVAGRSDPVEYRLDRRWRASLLTAALGLLAFCFIGLVGNRADTAALGAVSRRDWQAAAADSRRASAWSPWSAEALELEADVASAANNGAKARLLLGRAIAKDPSDYQLWAGSRR